MGEIVSLHKKNDQHGSGEAFCYFCKHEWVAVVPTGVTEFECPACETEKGRFKFPFYPKEGQMIRVCNCGNELFYLTPDGHLCVNCGIYQSY